MTKRSSVFPGKEVGAFGSARLCCQLEAVGLWAGDRWSRKQKTHMVKAQEDHQESWLITRSWLVTYKAVNKTPTIKVNLRVSCCALRYGGGPCCELGPLQYCQSGSLTGLRAPSVCLCFPRWPFPAHADTEQAPPHSYAAQELRGVPRWQEFKEQWEIEASRSILSLCFLGCRSWDSVL